MRNLIVLFTIILFDSLRVTATLLLPSKYIQAIELAGNSQYADAIVLLKQHIAEDSTLVPAYLRLAEFYRYERKLDEGRNYFQGAVSQSPENPNFYLGLALMAKWSLDWNQAFDHCKIALKKGSTSPEVLDLLVESALHLNQSKRLNFIFQELQRNKSQKSLSDLGYAIWHYRENEFSDAKRILAKYLDKHSDDWYAYYLLGKISQQMNDFEDASSFFEMAIQINGQTDPFRRLSILYELGLYYQGTGRVDSAEYCLNNAYELAQKLGAKAEQINIQQAHFNLWMQEGYYQKMVAESPDVIRVAQDIQEYDALSSLYYNLASAYAMMGDRDQAINFYLQTIKEAKKIENAELISKAYLELGREYLSLEIWGKALEYLNDAIRVAKEAGLSKLEHDALLNIGDIYKFQRDIDRAKRNYAEVLRYAQRTKEDRLIEDCLLKLANLYLNPDSNLSNAQYYLSLAEALALQNFQIHFTANHRWMQGLISLFEGNYEDAEILFSGSVQLGKESCSHVPILAGYAGLIKTYLAVERPDMAAAQADTALKYLHEIENLYQYEFESEFFDVHNDLFLPAATAFAKVGEASRIYDICEQAKVNAHRYNISELKFKMNPVIPDSVKRQLDALDKLMRMKQSELWRLWHGEGTESMDELMRIKHDLHQIRLDRNKAQSEMAQRYPDYIQLIRPSGESLNHLTKLLKSMNAYFVHYLVGENSTFMVVVRPDSVFYKQIKVSRNYLGRLVEQMSPLLLSRKLNVIAFEESQLSDFNLEIAAQLYQILVEPIINWLPSQSTLIISADDVLNLIPFECLVRNYRELSNKFDYAQAKFLVEDFPISYVSYAQLLNGYPSHNKQSKKNFLVLEHSNSIPEQFKKYRMSSKTNSGTNGKLRSVKLSEEDTKRIAAVIGKGESNLLAGEQATKERFLDEVSHYKFIHLAIPGILDDRQPLYSKLFFSNPSGSSDYLRSYESYKLKLNAELVTLDIGVNGQSLLRNGQAVNILAQGFMFSGAQSLLISLWNISRDSAFDLLLDFYSNLKMGMNKAVALQQAKINYLKKGNRNPYYWAPYITFGNPELTHGRSKSINYLIQIAVVSLFLSGIFLFLRVQRAKNKGGRNSGN